MTRTHSIRQIAVIGVLAALTAAASAQRITLPLEIAGTTSFHLGNILCALCGILLGPISGGLAAGIGSAMYDMTNPLYIGECWITFLFKFAYGFAAGWVAQRSKAGYLRWTLAALAGAVTYAALYLAKSYFYSGRLISGLSHEAALLALVGKIPATVFNAVVAVVFAPILASAILKALKQNRISLT